MAVRDYGFKGSLPVPDSRHYLGKQGAVFRLTMAGYIKIYEDAYGITWDRKMYHVHHIDRNRANNDIKNLVLLPAKLHQELHSIPSAFWDGDNITANYLLMSFQKAILNGYSESNLSFVLNPTLIILEKCIQWGIYKQTGYEQFTPNGIWLRETSK